MATAQRWPGKLSPIVFWLAGLKLAIRLWTSGSYNYFRDELYSRLVLGDSLRAIRFLPAVAVAGKVLLAGFIARELGGGRYAHPTGPNLE